MLNPIFSVVLDLGFLMTVAILVHMFSRRTGMPYTIFLALVGMAIYPLTHFQYFSFLGKVTLQPELLLAVFLPLLLFESGMQIKAKDFIENRWSIGLLSIASLLISAGFVALVLYGMFALFGFGVPFLVTLIFGALISATDPVAVLALFKEYKAPHRLSLIFEGESLFNDGTSFALFLVVMEIVMKGHLEGLSSLFEGVFLFTTMVVGGMLFGWLMAKVFTKFMEYSRGDSMSQLSLGLVVAHITFILSEIISHHLIIGGMEIKFSSIIATIIAAIMVGEWERKYLPEETYASLRKIWEAFAFLANSLIFVLIGVAAAEIIPQAIPLFAPVLLTIFVVASGRAVSVYPVTWLINRLKLEEHIPPSWSHLLSWGSLRGALAVLMALSVPESLVIEGWNYPISIHEFILILTVSCILFTLFVKGLTIKSAMRTLKVSE
jgi:CPA1 family monovalent cation:H+ antiporter